VHRKLCTAGKLNEARDFEADLAELDCRENDEPAKLQLTYSTLDGINRAGPPFGMAAVCIIQV